MSWFSIAGIKEEIRKIRWPNRKEMSRNTTIVITFVLFFVAYFFLTEFVLIRALKLLGIGG
ncbi:preprotein translocase subunit SecE [Erysipelothrix inopinata]|jgi:preprotein translocase subunit SecE|uniref:Protein translocase subunit SecE n=1 Tax=Erysipelothrix inopinata TaxID=225084 RepID=A0A7G9RZW1_9FIRM|nr:preprotein translocase subunit SecE [Erysipelothrix inopinata]QNN61136.1 preprotein translocase subunit SecE [Erysipelothrix inopinata]